MKLRYAVGAICLGALTFGVGPAVANEAVSGSGARVAYETGYVTTQGRRGGGGGIRRGRPGPVYVAPRRRNNVGRNVAIGVGAAIIGGIIASEAARAHRAPSNCERWAYQCDAGSNRACYNLDRYC
jgi:hypothetical protein